MIELFTFIKQSISGRVILVLSRPPKVHYKDVAQRIGAPKDFENNKKEDVFNKPCSVNISIPKDVLAKHGLNNQGEPMQVKTLKGEDIEMEQQDQSTGSRIRDKFEEEAYTPIKALSTFNYDWRIKARITKKGERRSWKNQRTEGYLLNVELMDKHGTQI